MNKKRKDYIADIVRYGTEAEIVIPTSILEEKIIEPDSFKSLRVSLEILKNDMGLIVTEEEITEKLTKITIEIRPDNSLEDLDE